MLHPLNSAWDISADDISGTMVLRCRSDEQQLQLVGSMLRMTDAGNGDTVLFVGSPVAERCGQV